MAKHSTVNPCGEIPLGDPVNCNLPPSGVALSEIPVNEVLKLVLRYVPATKEIKEGILNEALVCRCWGVDRDRVIILGWLGRVLIKVYSPEKILVSFVPGNRGGPEDSEEWCSNYVEFWSSQEELKILSDYLKSRMHLKVSFEMIYNGEI